MVTSLSLFYQYFHDRCSDELSSLVPPVRQFQHVTRFPPNSHLFTVNVPVSKSFYSNSFFPRTSVLWKSLPSTCSPSEYNLQTFKANVHSHFLTFRRLPQYIFPLRYFFFKFCLFFANLCVHCFCAFILFIKYW